MKKVILSVIIIITMAILVVGLEFVINNGIYTSSDSSNTIVIEHSTSNMQNQELFIIQNGNVESSQLEESSDAPITLRRIGNRFVDVGNSQNVYTQNDVRMISENQGVLNNQRVIIV
ncbi:MAG: hypothetical protein LAT82_05325 [Nanoarchaeota archaeon]|nr:hypothetical protein [Nanoarchaeota archaeon]